MTIRPIRVMGDPVLRTPADPVTAFDDELRRLVDDLFDTLDEDPEGRAGLAAPQIGVSLRVFAWDIEDSRGHLVNPTITEVSEEEQDDGEGCLSLPGLSFPTRRAWSATATGVDVDGVKVTVSGTELMARLLQHETDHLDGILYVDRLDREHRKEAMRAVRTATW